jgi:hypothetical protein
MTFDISAKLINKFAGFIKQFIEVVSHQQNLEETSMKKNFLTAVAVMVVGFFVATEIAQAADVTFSGQVRSRYESDGQRGTVAQGGFNDTVDNDTNFATRVRLNANVNINDSTSAFIQMQSTRTWGNATATAATNIANGGGSGNSSFSGSDADASVGLHQAYFTLKNFASLPVDVKLGRQEVVLDGHRLFGHTGWTTGAQTHDAIRLDHKHGNHTLTYAFIQGLERDRSADAGDDDDVQVHLVRANLQGILGGNLSLYGVAVDDNCGSGLATTTCTSNGGQTSNDSYTLGFRQAGQLFGIDYRGEYYWQGGNADQSAAAIGTIDYKSTIGIERDAYMFGVRIGKKFNNVAMKPSLTVWYDQLSGTDDADIDSHSFGQFNTLFDTGHKFYGHMDLFANANNNGTQGLGLVDLAIKASIQPMAGWTIKADYHWFSTEVDPSTNVRAATNNLPSGTDDDLGTELDLQIVNKYNANTVISAGWSQFAADQLFSLQRSVSSPTANWAYVQVDVKF